jgi:hypothetical protein
MEKKRIDFALLALKTEQFATFEENYNKDYNKNSNLNTSLEFKVDKDSKQIGVFLTFTFEQRKKVFLRIQVSCHFGIKPESWNTCFLESKMVFPKDFMTHIAMITTSSARGILHSKTEGTLFNQFLLPIIDTTKLVNTDVEFLLLDSV